MRPLDALNMLCGRLLRILPAEDDISAGGEGTALEGGLQGRYPIYPADEAATETLSPDDLRQAVMARASPLHLRLPLALCTEDLRGD